MVRSIQTINFYRTVAKANNNEKSMDKTRFCNIKTSNLQRLSLCLTAIVMINLCFIRNRKSLILNMFIGDYCYPRNEKQVINETIE
jgi:hypothetical protein